MTKHQPLLTTSDINADVNPLIEDDAGASLYAPSWLLGAGNAAEHFAMHPLDTSIGFDQLSFAPKSGGGGGGGSGGSVSPPPNLLQAIAGPTFDTVAQKSGFYMIPPDCTEATGKSALVAATNGEIEVFARDPVTGTANTTPAINESLNQLFFGANGGDTAFDPKVVYDAAHDKFIVVSLTENSTNHTSQILVAVSTDGTATHWNTQAFDGSLSTGGGSWADFPGVAVDGQGHIFISTNMFSFSGGLYEGSTLWTTDETLSSLQHSDPSQIAGVSNSGPNDLATLMPALMQGTNSDGTLPNGTFLVSYDGAKAANGDNILHVMQVDSAGNVTDHIVDVGLIDSAAAFSSFSAPQSQTTKTIDAGDDRVLDVVWQNGKLYAVTTIIPTSGPDAGHTTAHWFEIDTTNFTVVDQGNVSGSAIGAGDRTFYPAIAVDSAGDFAISFSVSGPQIHPSAYYAVHSINDPAGVLESAQLLAAGTDYYVRTFGTGDNRWGDFSSMSADPLHPGEFWAFNEYAMARGDKFLGFGESGRWATEIGAFMVPPPTTASPLSSTTTTGGTDLSSPTLGQIVDTHLPLPHDGIV